MDAWKRKQIAQLSDTALDCRTLTHRWRRGGVFHIENGLVVRIFHCECKSRRFDVYDGDVMTLRTYDYPDGYLIPGNSKTLERVSKADFKQAAAERYKPKGRSTLAALKGGKR